MDQDAVAQFYFEVGRQVRARRIVAGLTQAELADRVGLRRSSIANLEAGRQRILLHFIAAIAEAMHIETSDLLPSAATSDSQLDFGRLNDATAAHPEAVRSFVLDAVRSVVERDTDGPT